MKNVVLSRIESDEERMFIVEAANELSLPQWCIAAGFVRNIAWDYHHGYVNNTPLNDVDLIYFSKSNCSSKIDREIERYLKAKFPCNWSVKNQARMHERNKDQEYESALDAMSYWPELETAVGVTKNGGILELVSPFPLEKVLGCSISINNKRPKYKAFNTRVVGKGWLKQWPKLVVKAYHGVIPTKNPDPGFDIEWLQPGV